MNTVNIPYGYCLTESNSLNRNFPTSATFGENNNMNQDCLNIQNVNLAPGLYSNPDLNSIAAKNTQSVTFLDNQFLSQTKDYPQSYASMFNEYSNTDLQAERPKEVIKNSYIQLASESLHVYPDLVMSVLFSDDNINHLRNLVVTKVKEVTSASGVAGSDEGVTIMTPYMDDFFNYMLNIYKNYKIYNGSICFVNNNTYNNQTEYVKNEISKLNTSILQQYISKMISQINMYIYYYKDASQMPEQLSLPAYSSMKGSKTLEYNTGFKSGNSLGIAAYSQVSNIP